MVAMGIFVIMMTIMMQFFASAQKVWNASSKRNAIYSDARVAMNLMTRELECMLYENSEQGDKYPFWFEWTAIDSALDSTNDDMPTELRNYLEANDDVNSYSSTPYLTALNFISTTDIKPVEQGSDVCELSYRFVPFHFPKNTNPSLSNSRGGYLQRSCISEYKNPSAPTPNGLWDFALCYYRGVSPSGTNSDTGETYAKRVYDIWCDHPQTNFKTVINGVYSLKYTCYRWDSSSNNLSALVPMNENGNGLDGSAITTPIVFNLAMGTPCPVAIRIDMKLLDPKDLKKLAYYIYTAGSSTGATKNDADKQIRILKQKIRTFSKVIYLGNREE